MSTIVNYANLPSHNHVKFLLNRYPAFLPALVSSTAKNEYMDVSEFGTGNYFLRGSSFLTDICYLNRVGLLLTRSALTSNEYDSEFGLRATLQLKYNEKLREYWSEKDSKQKFLRYRKEKRTAPVWDDNQNKVIELTSEAPIVTFGGIDYIWLNQKECEYSSNISTMHLISLDIIAKAPMLKTTTKTDKFYFEDYDSNKCTLRERLIDTLTHPIYDYGKQEKLLRRLEKATTKNLTQFEHSLLLAVQLSSEDNYQKSTPILQEYQNAKKNSPFWEEKNL